MKVENRIETARLFLVPLNEEHLTTRYVGWLNDPEVVKYSEQRHHHHTLESCRAYMKSFAGTPHYLWAVMLKGKSNGHIGNMNAYVDNQNRVADIGIMIGEKRHWRCGYGLEAWKAVCDYLLRVAGMRKITAGAMALNRGIVGVMEKSGMVEDGIRAQQLLWEDNAVDVVHYALFGGR